MSDYEAQLGADPALLAKHQQMIDAVIKQIVDKGGKMNSRISWSDVEKAAVMKQRGSSFKKRKPGCMIL